jgi:hypothetical protein
MGIVGDMTFVSLVVIVGMMCEEQGRRVNLVYQTPYYV